MLEVLLDVVVELVLLVVDELVVVDSPPQELQFPGTVSPLIFFRVEVVVDVEVLGGNNITWGDRVVVTIVSP